MSKYKKSNMAWWKIALIVLACVLVVGALAGLITAFAVNKAEEKEGQLSTSAYSVGGLNEDGTYLDTKESIYTKNLFKSADLKCSLVFDHNISYRVFFYDYNEKFLSSTETLTDSYSDVPFGSYYCRVVITPDADQNVKWYEVKDYAKQLTVEYNENAKVDKIVKVDFKFEEQHNPYGDYEGNITEEDELYQREMNTTTPIKCSGYKRIAIVTKNANAYYFGDKDGKTIGQRVIVNSATSPEYKTFFVDIPMNAEYVRFSTLISYWQEANFSIYFIV